MAVPLSIGDAIFFIEKGIGIYKKIRDAPKILQDVNDRLKSLPGYLRTLEELLNDHKGLAGLRPDQAAEIREIVEKITADAKRASQILEACAENAGPGGLHFRFPIVAQSFFALVSGRPKELEDLTDSLERGRLSIMEKIAMMQSFALSVLLAHANSPGRRSPSPRKPKKNLNILFVDSANESRSVVSQAYAELVREWTIRTGNTWPISRIHSAGLLVESRGDLVDLQKSLKFKMTPGEKAPNDVALAALFDNKFFPYPYKQQIKQSVAQQTSRGLTKSTFSTYDYLIFFNYSSMASIEKLKDVVRNKHGDKAVPKGKGDTILLGKYAKSKWSEIWDPCKQADGSQSRQDWNRTVANIKVAFKKFLKEELGWIQPPKGAVQKL